MKKILITLIFVGFLFGVEQVPRHRTNKKTRQIEKTKKSTRLKKIKVKEDHFLDADSNAVNDQREDDYLKIKKMNSKFWDLFQKIFGNKLKKSRKKKRHK